MPHKTHHDPPEKIPVAKRVLFGGLAGMVATTIVHPLDLIKVRMQVSPESNSTRVMVERVIKYEGYKAFYTGLSAGLMRQATYTTTRLWVYNKLYEDFKSKHKMAPSVDEKVRMGIYAGMAGAIVGNPSEVALVRMMAAGKPDSSCGLPCYCRIFRPRYNGVFDALYKIVRYESVCALWRGGTLTLGRSVFVSAAQIGTYTRARELLRQNGVVEGYTLHFYTAMIASFVTTVLSLPVDLVKTRYQVQSGGDQASLFKAILKKKGVLYFWKGFLLYFLRMTVHSVVTFMMLEEINALYHEYLEEKHKKK